MEQSSIPRSQTPLELPWSVFEPHITLSGHVLTDQCSQVFSIKKICCSLPCEIELLTHTCDPRALIKSWPWSCVFCNVWPQDTHRPCFFFFLLPIWHYKQWGLITFWTFVDLKKVYSGSFYVVGKIRLTCKQICYTGHDNFVQKDNFSYIKYYMEFLKNAQYFSLLFSDSLNSQCLWSNFFNLRNNIAASLLFNSSIYFVGSVHFELIVLRNKTIVDIQ